MGFNADAIITMDASNATAMLLKLQLRLQAAGLEAFMHNSVVPWLQGRAAKRFGSEGDDASGRWTPLRRATELFRARQGFPEAHPINVRTFQMFDFITWADGSTSGGPGYASLNWPGSTGRAKAIAEKIRTAQGLTPGTVARPVLGLSKTDDIFITSRLLTYLLS